MDIGTRTDTIQLLAKTIMEDLEGLLCQNASTGQLDAEIIALKEYVDDVTCFSDLHDYVDANTLGESEEVWQQLTGGIGPEGDEEQVQMACDVVSGAQSIVDEWIKQGSLRALLNSTNSPR